MHLLIDADSLLYKAGFVANEPGQEALACWQLDTIMNGILEYTKCTTYQCYLTGGKNFRYSIYPEYKANRKDMQRPIHLEALKEHLIHNWGSTMTDGIEADDACGIALYRAEDEVAVAHIDKDLNMLAGRHYNFNKQTWYNVSDLEANQFFFYQLIMGDRADNIPGYDGKMRGTVPKFLQPFIDNLYSMTEPEEMLDWVSAKWGCDVDEGRWHEFNQAAHALWIQRKEESVWTDFLDNNTMAELGLPVDLIRSLPALFDQPVDDGLPNINA